MEEVAASDTTDGASSVIPVTSATAAKPQHAALTANGATPGGVHKPRVTSSVDSSGSLWRLLHRNDANGSDGPQESRLAKEQPSLLKKLCSSAKKHWFLIGVAFVVCLAAAYPDLGKKKGILRTDIVVNYVAVAIIFVLSGVGMKTKVLSDALLYWKMHLIIQGLNLGLFPLVVFGLGKLLVSVGFNKALAEGLIIACSTPTTIASNVLMTKSGYGNEPAALMNAVLGNIFGVFVSPALIGAYTAGVSQGSSSSVNYSDVFVNLGVTVIGPLVLGQLIQYFSPGFVAMLKRHISFPHLSSTLLLLLVYSVFCNTFAENVAATTPPSDLVAIVFIDVAVLLLFASVSFAISVTPGLGFTRSDTVAIVNCAATKTLALGVPIITVMFGDSPLVGLYSIPLIIYHAEQIILGTFLVSAFQKWVRKGPPTPYVPEQADEEVF